MRPIDADALKRVIYEDVPMKYFNARNLDKAYQNMLHLLEVVNQRPTLDIMPVVHGRWVKMTGMMPPEYHGHYECSECQWHMKGLRNSWTREEELSYCPNCGAKMDGEVMSE